MFYFSTRTIARTFSQKAEEYRLVDNGPHVPRGRRWGVKVI